MNPNQAAKEILPEIPPEVHNRMARGTALTQDAADELHTDEVSVAVAEGNADSARNSGPTSIRLRERQERLDADQIARINELTKAPPGFEPAAGMPAAEVMKIMGRNYPGQPAQDPMFGDRTPEFICWLFENHPVDAHIRYLSRLMPDAGRWIAKAFPKFKYVPGKRVPLKVGDFVGEAFQDPNMPKGFLSREKVVFSSAELPSTDSPEVTALKARIAELEKKAHHLVEVKAKRKYTRKAPPAAQTPAKAAKTPGKPTQSTQPSV